MSEIIFWVKMMFNTCRGLRKELLNHISKKETELWKKVGSNDEAKEINKISKFVSILV